MSFYLRYVPKTNRVFIKTNADLFVANEEYNCRPYTKIFNNFYVIDEDRFRLVENCYDVVDDYNKNLLISDFNLDMVKLFLERKGCNSAEILLPIDKTDEEINLYIEEVISHFKDTEFSIGLLISNEGYIERNNEYIKSNGFLISKFIQRVFDENKLEKNWNIMSLGPCKHFYDGGDVYFDKRRNSARDRFLLNRCLPEKHGLENSILEELDIEESFKD